MNTRKTIGVVATHTAGQPNGTVLSGFPYVSEISGRAWVAAYSTYVMDASDPFGNGFSLTI